MAITLAAGGNAEAQAPSQVVPLTVGQSERAIAGNVSQFWYHILPAHTDAAEGVSLDGPAPFHPLSNPPESGATSFVLRVPNPGFYPADVTLQNPAAALVTSAKFDNIYVSSPDDTPWGNPVAFETDLGNSKFIHLVDQYVGSKKNKRYSFGQEFSLGLNPCSETSAGLAPLCTQDDILAIVAAAATSSNGGTGLGIIYHVFLLPGTDTCFDSPANTQCYSPDVPQNFVFCAYHSAALINGNVTLFTVEPFQNVSGCAAAPPNPNSALIDSTNSVLSHETFETISDPEGDAWRATSSLINLEFGGPEIGDECQVAGGFYPTFVINKTKYEVQTEYSNKFHACSAAP